jgi:hypothetical protein
MVTVKTKAEVTVKTKAEVTDKTRAEVTDKTRAEVTDKAKAEVMVKTKAEVMVKDKAEVMARNKAEAHATTSIRIASIPKVTIVVVTKAGEVIVVHTVMTQAEAIMDQMVDHTADVEHMMSAVVKVVVVLLLVVPTETQVAEVQVTDHHAEATPATDHRVVVLRQWVATKYVALPPWEAEHHTAVAVLPDPEADVHHVHGKDHHEAVHVLHGK